jgi:hypothetical protein
LRRPVLAFERHGEEDDMAELPRNDLDCLPGHLRLWRKQDSCRPDRCDPKPSEKPSNLPLRLTSGDG